MVVVTGLACHILNLLISKVFHNLGLNAGNVSFTFMFS